MTMNQDMQNCMDNGLRCYQICFGMVMNHCLESGGKHGEPARFWLMTACTEICTHRRIS